MKTKLRRIYLFWAIIFIGLLATTEPLSVASSSQGIIINEFLAANFSDFTDEDGDQTDWIEIYNPNTRPVNLAQWSLTDDPLQPDKWFFPDIELAGNQYLLIFASGKNRRPSDINLPLHTNFEISRQTGFLGLYVANSRRYQDAIELTYPAQERNVSYGQIPEHNQFAYFDVPTPGRANHHSPLWAGALSEVEFSVVRGFYQTPFSLTLSVNTPDTPIYYTDDGSEPSQTNGQLYTEPISITKTSFIRAIAAKPNYKPAPVATHSYIFVDDILSQWWMTAWLTDNPTQRPAVQTALSQLPSLSIVTNPANYDFYYDTEAEVERPVSVEWIDETTASPGFQINAGISLHGHTALEKPKKSFRLYFRRKYGAGQVSYPFFPDSPVSQFNTLILRGGGNRNFTGGERWRLTTTYGRDEWLRLSEQTISSLSAHGRFAHLYLNGQYWGLYNLVERPDAFFSAAYFGGEREDWYVRNHWDTVDGDSWRFRRLEALVETGDLSQVDQYNELQTYISPSDFADHLIVNWYAGNRDWPHNNWYLVGRYTPEPFKHFSWDGEVTWVNGADLSWEKPDYLRRNYVKPLFDALWQNHDFRLTLADRIYQHLFGNGPLTAENAQARWKTVHQQIEAGILAEIARWGDEKEGVEPVTFAHWQQARDQVLAQMANNVDQFIEQARAAGYYPPFDPPTITTSGSLQANNLQVTLASAAGQIYYTVDGSDPRAPTTGQVGPTAKLYQGYIRITHPLQLKARVRVTDTWSALAQITLPQFAAEHALAITEIMYHPKGDEASEFLEIKNISNLTLDLSYMSFSGIDYTFPVGSTLKPQAYWVLVRDETDFVKRYPGISIGGEYEGKLSNKGEQLSLKDASGNPIITFTYRDSQGWPLSADGRGDSLTLIHPTDDPALPQNWRASRTLHGSPGKDD